MRFIRNKIHIYVRTKKWRNKNKHNDTVPVNDFDQTVVTVGKATYGELFVSNFNINERLVIGSYCSIGPNVAFLLNSDHGTQTLSTFPYRVKTLKSEKYEALSKGNIIVDDDVWIGYGAIILSGVHIGQGAVIAAGAVVSKSIPPYAIVAGVPSKIIKYRFEKDIRDYLLTFDYSSLTDEAVKEHEKEMYMKLDGMEVNQLKKLYEWFPKKKANKNEET